MASPNKGNVDAPSSAPSLRRRRVDTTEDDAIANGTKATVASASASASTSESAPALKKLKLDSDDGDVGVTDTSSGDDGVAASSLAEQEDDNDVDNEDDDMDLAATQPTAILPDDEDDDDDNDSMDSVEIPSTPPPVQLTPAALARQARASPALRIDPMGQAAKATTTATTTTATTLARPSLPTNSLVFRVKFPLLSDKSRLLSPVQRDADGQAWRVLWYPHGQFLNGEFVSVFVEMVVDEVDDADDAEVTTSPETTGASNGHAAVSRVCDRHAVVEIAIVDPRHPADRKISVKSGVILFEKENLEFGVEKLARRTRISNPSELLLDAHGDVELDVRLHFVNAHATEAINLDVDLDADSTVSPVDEEDLLGTTPVVTPTAGGLTIGTPTTPSHHDLLLHDSKKETGMVGLKNQGATCYMNSLLQTLYHLLAFRHVVYETPTDREDTNDSVSLALQRVFYRLQTQTKAVSTKELTRSFGWSQMDAFMQHDVQELYRILCDRLEEKMKNTKVDNAIKKLFEGKVRSFVQCVNVDFQSFRDESFYDLQLDVKGCKDIYDSFRKYVEIEMLDGDNQYEAEGHGKQDAKKGVKFLQFPPVLNIQLKRFEYDPMRDGMVKIHDRFEYPKTLTLNEFAPKQSDDAGSNQLVYHLHSVLVHSGDVHGGHYYVFIRPAKDLSTSDEWFRFDDDQISRVDEHTAVEGNYGSGGAVHLAGGSSPSTPLYGSILSPEITPRDGGDNAMDFRPLGDGGDAVNDGMYNGPAAPSSSSLMLPTRSFASAYMLVYVRDGANDTSTVQDEAEQVTDPSNGVESDSSMADQDVPPADVKVPESLLLRFHEEEKASARRKKAQQTEHLYMLFRIASDTSVAKLKKITKTIDFSSFGNNHGLRIRIKRTASIHELYSRIYRRTGVPVAHQRLWKVITRENRTHRPDTPISLEMLNLRADALIDDDASPKAPVRLYLQIIDADVDTSSEQMIARHFWTEFTPPEDEKSADAAHEDNAEPAPEDEDDDLLEDPAVANDGRQQVLPAPNVRKAETLLFIKFYDLNKKLGDRLEYMGNILFDSRKTGRDLAAFLHEALHIPTTHELILYEEIQPISVSEISMDTSLEAAEIQHGDIICYQLADDEEKAQEVGENGEILERYPDVPSYFQYLLDRVDVLFYQFGHPEDEPLIVHLLFSHCYDDIIVELAKQLGFSDDKRLYLRLYQHSPLNQLPKKNPLRHSRFSGDRQSTVEDFLTEYSERTNVMYYEILTNPITEIESKKQVSVYLSTYDECFVDSSSPITSRRLDCLVAPSDGLSDLLTQIATDFELDASTQLRACEVSHNGSLLLKILKTDASLEKYWMPSSSTGYTTVNDVALFVERIPDEESQAVASYADVKGINGNDGEESENELFHFGVVHFNFQMAGQHWIHPHGTPCVTYFREQDAVSEVKERIRRRMGISDEVFAKWELAVVKESKASTVRDLYQDMEPETIDSFAMSKLEDVCGPRFENITSLGVEHADMKPSAPKYARRQEQGIKIRQS